MKNDFTKISEEQAVKLRDAERKVFEEMAKAHQKDVNSLVSTEQVISEIKILIMKKRSLAGEKHVFSLYNGLTKLLDDIEKLEDKWAK